MGSSVKRKRTDPVRFFFRILLQLRPLSVQTLRNKHSARSQEGRQSGSKGTRRYYGVRDYQYLHLIPRWGVKQ